MTDKSNFKVRTATTTQKEDKFIEGVDNKLSEIDMNPKATRTRQLGIKVNAYEYERIEALANELDRSIASTLRYAVNKAIKDNL